MRFFRPNPNRRACDLPWRRWRALAAALAAMVITTGCWEEIHYQPPANATKAPAAKVMPKEPETDSDESPPANAESAAEPSADELFGGDSGPPPVVITAPAPATDTSATETITPAPPIASISPQERLDAWTLASSWSLAAGIAAKGLGPDRYEPMLAKAQQAAAALGVDVPLLPTADEESADAREAAVVAALRTGAGAELVRAIARRLDDAAGAAGQLAIDSHALLLSYSPSSSGAADAAAGIRAAGQSAELPAELWQPLVELLNDRADFKAIRGAVFGLHENVAGHLKSLVAPRAAGTR
jgi:hypothetical protein